MTISTEVAGQMKYESVFAGHRCPMCGGEVRVGVQEAIREDVPVDPLVGCSCFGKCQWTGRLSECVKTEDCVKALLAVNAHLVEFCDNGRSFHAMAVEAARRTIKDLEYVRRKHEWQKNKFAELVDGLQKEIRVRDVVLAEHAKIIKELHADLWRANPEQLLAKDDDRSSNESKLVPPLDLTLSQNVKCSVSDDVLTLKINLNSNVVPSAEKMPAQSSCVHSCMAVQDQVVEIQSLHEEIDRLNEELSSQIAYKDQNRLVIQERNKTIQERDQEISRLHKELSDHVAHVEQRDLTIQELHRMIQERDQEINRLKGRVEALERDIGVMSQDYLTAVLALQESKTVDQAQKETIQNQCTEIRRLKNRIGTFMKPNSLENWINRAEKAEVELEKIKEYAHRWTEAKCEDPNCEFCSKRPENPLN